MTSQPVIFYKSSSLVPPAPAAPAPAPAPARKIKKAFTRRRGDRSQQIRTAVQVFFSLITVWVGVQFWLWVRYFEHGGTTLRVERPDGVEAWLPIASLMNLKTFLVTHRVPEAHAAGMFMLIAFLAISFLYRKAFCSWVCPVGMLNEWMWQTGRTLFGRTFALPRWLDIPLRGLKYILLALFLFVVVTMSVEDINAFLNSPYGLVADVKMLNFFRYMGEGTAIFLVVLLGLSLVVKNVWCRYLCPYGALMGLTALVSPTRIVRDPAACIDCDKCTKACPAGLPVATLLSVHSAECTACMSCVAVCPAEKALDLKTGIGVRSAVVQPWALAVGIFVLFLGIVGYARVAGYWHTSLPDHVYFQVVPNAAEYEHPR
ncbi:MAG TPA: 4Fe-4S binding protein [Vicinamibacterales bacterium]|nr:4Fe-4S binding protein [Vicinamibacterales bacterium]